MRLSITDIARPEHDHTPVWVLNKSRGDTRGPILFTCPRKGTNDVNCVRVPDTFIPINVLDHIPKDQLLDSVDFRNALNKGLIVIIDELEAREILSKPGVDQEIDRLNQQQSKINTAHAAIGADIINTEEPTTRVHRKVEQILNQVGDTGEVGAINQFRNIQDDIELEDLEYIMTYASKRGLKNIKKYARNRLNEI